MSDVPRSASSDRMFLHSRSLSRLALARTRTRFRPAFPSAPQRWALPLSPGAPPRAAEESPVGRSAARSPATATQALLLRFHTRQAIDEDVPSELRLVTRVTIGFSKRCAPQASRLGETDRH